MKLNKCLNKCLVLSVHIETTIENESSEIFMGSNSIVMLHGM